jgi:hypothetical protein
MIEQRTKELELASRSDASILDRREILGLMTSEAWTVRMLVCRMLARVAWPPSEYKLVRDFALEQVRDKNTFVRAWALDALASFAVFDESLREGVLDLINETLASGPPSMRVRAREGLRRIGG